MNLFGDAGGVTERERQMTDLLDTVRQAQQVARMVCNSRPDDSQAKLLFGRLDAVRLEIEQIRRDHRAVPFEDIDPKWTGPLPWRIAPEC
jgi:hypothetical protein